MKIVHYADTVDGKVKHTVGVKLFGRYLIVTWVVI